MDGDGQLTFQFGFEGPKVRLVHDHQSLLPFASSRNHLTDLFCLFFVCERTYSVARNDVFENRELRKNSKFADYGIIDDRVRMTRSCYRGQGECMQSSEQAELQFESNQHSFCN